MLQDIQNIDDIKILVDKFYEKVNKDELLSPIFNDIAKIDWEEHLPIMYSFWHTVLFFENDYKGEAYKKHLNLPISKSHFKKWLDLFFQTLDENFKGEKVNKAKESAVRIADIFQVKMGIKKHNISIGDNGKI